MRAMGSGAQADGLGRCFCGPKAPRRALLPSSLPLSTAVGRRQLSPNLLSPIGDVMHVTPDAIQDPSIASGRECGDCHAKSPGMGMRNLVDTLVHAGHSMIAHTRPTAGYLAIAMQPLPGGGWGELWRNRVFVAGLTAWFVAQFAKIFTKRYKKGVWDLMAFRDSGGMPSSHSAMSMAVTTAIALEFGFAHPLFAVAICFTSIVMYDAAGVRKHAGYQAEVLNSLVEHAGLPDSHPFSARKLKEVLGHTPRQVIVGGLLGILVGMLIPGPA